MRHERWIERLSLVIATLFAQTIFLSSRTAKYSDTIHGSIQGDNHHAISQLSPSINTASSTAQERPSFLPRTLFNFTADQGYEPVDTPMVMDAEVIGKYRRHYNIGDKPLVYFITPTYQRPTQLVDLVTVSQSIQHDKATYWIVVEDASQGSMRVRDLLERSGMLFAHLAILSPASNLSKQRQKKLNKPRGVLQRNLGIDTAESLGIPGVIYFGDDDNKYDGM